MGRDAKRLCVRVAFTLTRSCAACSSPFLSLSLCSPRRAPGCCPPWALRRRRCVLLRWVFRAVYIELDLFSVASVGDTWLCLFFPPPPFT